MATLNSSVASSNATVASSVSDPLQVLETLLSGFQGSNVATSATGVTNSATGINPVNDNTKPQSLASSDAGSLFTDSTSLTSAQVKQSKAGYDLDAQSTVDSAVRQSPVEPNYPGDLLGEPLPLSNLHPSKGANYASHQSLTAKNELQDKAALIKAAQKAGISHDQIKKSIDNIDKGTTNEVTSDKHVGLVAVNDPSVEHSKTANKYKTNYENHGGSKNHDADQKVLKLEAKLAKDQYQNKQNQERYYLVEHPGSSIKDLKKSFEKTDRQTNQKLGMSGTTAQNKAEKTAVSDQAIKNFEKQNHLSDNRSDRFIAQTQLQYDKLTKNGGNTTLNNQVFIQQFNQLYQKDLQDGTATVKDSQLSSAFNTPTAVNQTSQASQTQQLMNQNGRTVQSTLARYNQDSNLINDTLTKQNDLATGVEKDTKLPNGTTQVEIE